MPLRNTKTRWGALSQAFHWLIVALILLQVTLAKIAEDLPIGIEKIATLARHKSVGITILALAVLRLAWRWANPVPELPANLSAGERRLAQFSHASLYVLLFALPLSGWAMSSARGFPVSWWGLVQLPDFVPTHRPLYDALHEVHELLGYALAAVVLLHVAGALRHHFVKRDDVLRRMLPYR